MNGDRPADADVVVDALGLKCPLPVIRLAQAARGCRPGAVLELWADDPAARADVPAWCRLRGHEFLGAADTSDEAGGHGDRGGYGGHGDRGGRSGRGGPAGDEGAAPAARTAYRVRLAEGR